MKLIFFCLPSRVICIYHAFCVAGAIILFGRLLTQYGRGVVISQSFCVTSWQCLDERLALIKIS